MNLTKAAAKRWLDSHVGQEIDTRQVKPTGITWEPGSRTLAKTGSKWTLDGSRVEVTANHVVIALTESSLSLEWQDSDGVRIHVTTYTVVTDDVDDTDSDDEDL